MPPPDSGKVVSTEELAMLKGWMESGAKWSRHWAFDAQQVVTPSEGKRRDLQSD